MTYTLSTGSNKKIDVANVSTNKETSLEFIGKFKPDFEPIFQQNLIHLLTNCRSKEYTDINSVPLIVGQTIYIKGTPPRMFLCTNDNPKTIEELVLTSTNIDKHIVPNNPPTGNVTIDISGNRYTANTSAVTDPDGLGPFKYQWSINGVDIAGATSVSHTCTTSDIGKTLKVTVSYYDLKKHLETITSSGVIVADTTLTYIPSISIPTTIFDKTSFVIGFDIGTAPLKTGDTVTITIQDSGTYFESKVVTSLLVNNAYSYTVNGLATGSYTVNVTRQPGDNNQLYYGSTTKSFNSLAKQTAATGSVAITWDKGTATNPSTDSTLTATPTNIVDINGINQSTITYDWYNGVTKLNNPSADKSKYKIQASDLNGDIRAIYSFKDNLGNQESIISSSIKVTLGQVPVGGTLALSYTSLTEGNILTIDESGIIDPNSPFTNKVYSWYIDNIQTININNATSHMIVSSDSGKTIKASLTYTDSLGNTETISTVGTLIPANPSVTITIPTTPPYNITVSNIMGETATLVNHTDAVTFCDNLVLDSFSDWRLPTVLEAKEIAKQLGQYGKDWTYTGTNTNRFGSKYDAPQNNKSFPDFYWCSDYNSVTKQYSWIYMSDYSAVSPAATSELIGVRAVRTA